MPGLVAVLGVEGGWRAPGGRRRPGRGGEGGELGFEVERDNGSNL